MLRSRAEEAMRAFAEVVIEGTSLKRGREDTALFAKLRYMYILSTNRMKSNMHVCMQYIVLLLC